MHEKGLIIKSPMTGVGVVFLTMWFAKLYSHSLCQSSWSSAPNSMMEDGRSKLHILV